MEVAEGAKMDLGARLAERRHGKAVVVEALFVESAIHPAILFKSVASDVEAV